MAWFTRFTRFADMHLVYGQERGMSCGPSSIVMCLAKINKLSLSQAVYPEERVRSLYASVNGGSDEFVFNGSSGHGLANTLNALGCGTWTSSPYSYDLLVSKVGVHSAFSGPVVSVEPVILIVGWSDGGAHAVCVDTIRGSGEDLSATICDPGDANVHIQNFSPTGFTYAAKTEQFWDAPGTTEHISAPGGVVTTEDRAHYQYRPSGRVGRAGIIIHRT